MVCATIGGIFLYKSYAYYEEDKEYNVIKGIIPDFGHDIKLSFTIDGKESTETFPNKDGNYVGSSVTCSNDVTAEWDNVNWGLKNIVANNNKKVNCNVNFKTKTTFQEKVKVGDYVKMTPPTISFKISGELTGCAESSNKCNLGNGTGEQTIKPSELNLWRVLSINEDGSIEMVSKYTSSNDIHFYGKTGFANVTGVLNMLASSYASSKYTIETKIAGYTGQMEYIQNEISTNKCGSNSTDSSNWDSSLESYGCGDLNYKKFAGLVSKLSEAKASKVNQISSYTNYWLGSRIYVAKYNNAQWWGAMYTNSSGVVTNMQLYINSMAQDHAAAIRPIVTLKSGLETSGGNGSSGSPWVLK